MKLPSGIKGNIIALLLTALFCVGWLLIILFGRDIYYFMGDFIPH
jgi:hypothetical protein